MRIALVMLTALALVAVGTPTNAAERLPTPVGPWSVTHQRPPDRTSVAGGVSARVANVAGAPTAIIQRYDDSVPAQVVDTVTVPASGHIYGSYIDDSGTIVVVAARAHNVFGLVWRDGEEATGWTKLATYPLPDSAFRIYTDTDEAGDVAVFHGVDGFDSADTDFVAYEPSTGAWSEPRRVHADVAEGSYPPLVDLAPTGDLLSVSTRRDGDTMTATLLRRPLDAATWTRHKVIQSGSTNVVSVQVEGGDTPDAASFVLSTIHKSVIGFVSDGVVHRHQIFQGIGSTFFMHVDGPGVARFLVSRSLRQFGAISYDAAAGGWSHLIVLGPPVSLYLVMARSDRSGDLLFVFAAKRHFDRLSAVTWRPGEPPSDRVVVTGRRLVLDDAAWLDNGQLWIRGNAHHPAGTTKVWVDALS